MTLGHLILRYSHITAGMVGLASGAIAMAVRKGATTHVVAGRVFTISMLVMAAAGASIAYFITPVRGNALGGMLAFYLVLTAWVTAWRRPRMSGRLEWIGMAMGAAVAVTGSFWGAMAQQLPHGALDGYPALMYFVFAGIAALGSGLDLRFIMRGGLAGAARTTRHLWRECVAMFIATGSFFIGQSRFFPLSIRESGVLRLPVIAVVVCFAYWMARVRIWPVLRRLRVRRLAGERA